MLCNTGCSVHVKLTISGAYNPPIYIYIVYSKKSPTGPTERTPKTWVSNSSSNLLRGPLVRSHSIFDGYIPHNIWSNYSDLTRPGPPKGSWGFGNSPKNQWNLGWWNIRIYQVYTNRHDDTCVCMYTVCTKTPLIATMLVVIPRKREDLLWKLSPCRWSLFYNEGMGYFFRKVKSACAYLPLQMYPPEI